MKPVKMISKLFKIGALVSLVSMIGVVTLQVFARYFLESTPHWTEEAARMLFIYAVAFGTGTGIQNGDFIRLDLIEKYLSPQMGWWLNVVTDILIIVFAVLLAFGSIQFIRLGMDEMSPALELPMGLVFVSILLIGLSIILFTLVHLQQMFKHK